jgi:hypothetical protein
MLVVFISMWLKPDNFNWQTLDESAQEKMS